MEQTEKLRILLQHWIEHNGGHVAEFLKWRTIMAEEKRQDLAGDLDNAVNQMNAVSHILRDMLDRLGGPAADGDGSHHHLHHHHHHH
ncbi:hypothetical protein [Desulfofustis limnaeus]|jgi:hypothetical protein|uniref:DUF8180 domain-containing protein n=1 Tax=Desulfofustis limnaeus TaxID=2740163 RepID=A0ABM7WB18_9BACT|nr:hypothetical protein [Desulfofustis limnaeus]MDX9896185.1 hypothetical protein [Desulfofustis sp.]BDD88172.1 hypothetical protein DPPLL_25370 [Desulfofustis limnaeus]